MTDKTPDERGTSRRLSVGGICCVVVGLLVNEVVLEKTVVLDGEIASRLFSVALLVFEGVLVGVGLYLLKARLDSPRLSVWRAAVGRFYRRTAVMAVNVVLALIVVNVALLCVFNMKEKFSGEDREAKLMSRENPVFRKYEADWRELYPGMSRAEVNYLLNETWSREYVYEPFTQFRERPFKGIYVNVEENGFRVGTAQGPWPPDAGNFNVFLFGGSTTFNYGVSDDQTIASHLQRRLTQARPIKPVKVYNFGRGHYYSSQERVFYNKLLVEGHVPDMAVFVDGLNEFFYHREEPVFSYRLSLFMMGRLPRMTLAGEIMRRLPMSRLLNPVADAVRGRLARPVDADAAGEVPHASYDDPVILDGVIRRYLANMKLIETVSEGYGVVPVFVWQPVPTYLYDLERHLSVFTPDGFGAHRYSAFGYPRMSDFVKRHPMRPNFLWCADVQQGVTEGLYVDQVHYTGRMSDTLAGRIVELIMERGLLGDSAR